MNTPIKTTPFSKLPLVQLLAAVGISLFWIYFFLFENSTAVNSRIYLAYERSFPLPDLGLIVPLLIGSVRFFRIGNREANKKAVVLTIASGGAFLFLGLVDFAFNIQNGIYTKSTFDAVLNPVINVFCIAFGAISVRAGYQLMD